MFDEQLGQIPTEPPRSPALLRGLRFRSVLMRWTLIIPLAVLMLSSLFAIAVILTSPGGNFLLRQTRVTNGTVISADANPERQYVKTTYKFLSGNGVEYRNTRYLLENSPYAGVKPGETIPVQFVLHDPSINRIVEGEKPNDVLVFLSFLPLFFWSLILSPLILARLIRILRDRMVFRRGYLAQGIVLFVKPSAVFMWWGWSGASTAEVFVRFQEGPTLQHEARALCQNDWLLKHLSPGAPVHIAYLRKRPSRAVLLEAYVR